jgi:hypothetical protein
MTVQIEVAGRTVTFALVAERGRWECPEKPKEGDFPLITSVHGKRYELYSDGTFAEVER